MYCTWGGRVQQPMTRQSQREKHIDHRLSNVIVIVGEAPDSSRLVHIQRQATICTLANLCLVLTLCCVRFGSFTTEREKKKSLSPDTVVN